MLMTCWHVAPKSVSPGTTESSSEWRVSGATLCEKPLFPSLVKSGISLVRVASACWRQVTLKVNRGGSVTGFSEGEINGNHSSYLYILLIGDGTDPGVCSFAVIGDNTDCYQYTWAVFKDRHSSCLVLILSSKWTCGAGSWNIGDKSGSRWTYY